jgi:DNA-binding transcriptional ArsR family regulator
MVPDYDLEPSVTADTPRQLKAIAEPVRGQILDLVLERAATVTELASALGRPKSSVAYHVDVLVDAGLLQVVRTRKVRAIEERFYGRTGRTIIVGNGRRPRAPCARTSSPRHRPKPSWRSPATCARHCVTLASRPSTPTPSSTASPNSPTSSPKLPRSGDTVFGLVAAVYRTDHPTLPEPS